LATGVRYTRAHVDRLCDCGACKLCKNRVSRAKFYAEHVEQERARQRARYAAHREEVAKRRRLAKDALKVTRRSRGARPKVDLNESAMRWLQEHGFREGAEA